MSLWCGACRTEIFNGFGILEKTELAHGTPKVSPNNGGDSPPNAAICESCWNRVPQEHRLAEPTEAADPDARHVYTYAPADSSNSPLWGSKQWSDITRGTVESYLRTETVRKFLSKALDIIDDMEDRQLEAQRSVN